MKLHRNKIMLSVLALGIITPAMVAPAQTEAATYSKTFKDVTKNNVNYDMIHEMAQQGIIKGYEDNTFRGGNEVTRFQVASLVYRYLGDNLPVQNKNATIPSDVTPKSEHYNAMVALIKAGLISPKEDGNIHPNKPITRAEMAKILVRAFDVEIKAQYDFADTIEGDAETRDYVRALYSNGITTGYLEDATFRPEKSLTRQQFAVFMHRSINVDPNYEAPPIELPPSLEVEEESPQNGYNRYEINLERTPESEYEKYSSKIEDIQNKDVVYPKVNNFTSVELYEYQKAQLESYKVNLKANQTLSVSPRLEFGFNETVVNHIAKREGISNSEMLKIMNYVQKTGTVYKGEKIGVFYNYSDNAQHFMVVARTR